MQKLQIFAVRAEGRFRLGLIRNAGHLPGLFKKAEPDYVCLITPPPLPSSLAYVQLRLWQLRLGGADSACFGVLIFPCRRRTVLPLRAADRARSGGRYWR